MGSSLLEFQSVGGHGCNRDAKVGEEVIGCRKFGCPDCEARRAVEQMLRAGVGTFEKARFVHWPGTDSEVVDEATIVGPTGKETFESTGEHKYTGKHSSLSEPGTRLKWTRRKRDFQGNTESGS